jgi:protein ImuA
MGSGRDDLSGLRQAVSGLEQGFGPAEPEPFMSGASNLDEPLGGLARGALHEIYAQAQADAAAASGFATALALRAAGERPILWARQDFVDVETGWLYAPGLMEMGLDPDRVILIRARDTVGVLRAGAEAARCPALGAVLIEPWGEHKALNLTATRRLSLAAAKSGVTLFLLRIAARPMPSSALTRWSVRARRSSALEANAPGLPAFAVTLLRHRAGLPARDWHVEWDRDRRAFNDASPLSRAVVPVPAGRTVAAAWEGEWRQAG